MVSPVYGQGILPTSGAVTSELNAVTRRAFVKRLVVQLYKATPLFALMFRNAQVARGGVSQITVPIQGSQFVNASWTGYDGTFAAPQVQNAAQAASWNLAMGIVPIPLLGMESLVQSSEAIIPLVKARFADANTVMRQMLASSLFSSNASNPLAMNGLQDAYDDGTAVATYGGISRNSNAFWKSTKYTTSFNISRSNALTRIGQVTQAAGGDKPDFIILSLSDWTALAVDFMGAEQFNTTPTMRYGEDDVVNAGFSCLMIAGIPVYADPFLTKGTGYIINSKYLSMYVSDIANFEFSGFESMMSNMQIGYIGAVLAGLQTVCVKPSTGMQMTNIANGAF
jgi:hypothetical protein